MKEAIQKAIEGGYAIQNSYYAIPVVFTKLVNTNKYHTTFEINDTCWKQNEKGEDIEVPMTTSHHTSSILLDPLFWQCLGKSLGWNEVEIYMSDYENDHPFMGGTIDYPYGEGAGMTYKVEGWKYYWLQFINHLAEGKDAEEFFNNFN